MKPFVDSVAESRENNLRSRSPSGARKVRTLTSGVSKSGLSGRMRGSGFERVTNAAVISSPPSPSGQRPEVPRQVIHGPEHVGGISVVELAHHRDEVAALPPGQRSLLCAIVRGSCLPPRD